MMSKFYFPRPKLAQDIIRDLAGASLFSDAVNGIFLAAPRRTGKTTFLQNELKPALVSAGNVVVYVDLWTDKRRDPGDLIAEAIAMELNRHLGVVAKAAKATGVDQVNLGGMLRIDAARIGKVDGMTLTKALQTLKETAKKPVALIVDEAQHALTSAEGDAAMTALKSARDQMNSPHETGLMLIMSGSDRDKLLRLVNSNAAPFYGSTISRMPELDADFIAHIAQLIENASPQLKPVAKDVLWEAFQRFANRPQPFIAALGQILNPVNSPGPSFAQEVLRLADEHRGKIEQGLESRYKALRPIERAVLWRMLELKDDFRPYDADALRFYREVTQESVTAQKAQAAIDALRAQTPSLIWKSAKGEYSLDDTSMYRWFEKRKAAGTWPPTGETAMPQEED